MTRIIRSSVAVLLVLAFVPAASMAQEQERSYTISPNERIHVIQRKTDLVDGRFELTFYPFTYQINSRWTRHLGQGMAAAYHLSETFALQGVFGLNELPYVSVSEETDLMTELREKARLQPDSANSVITQWYGMAAFEMAPIYGKIAFYEEAMMQFGLFLTVGAGVVGTKLQVTPRGDGEAPVFASAGLRGGGLVGGGFRVHLPGRWMLRVEVRDLVYSARIDTLNGCTQEDLGALSGLGGNVAPGCRSEGLEGHLAGTARSRIDHSSNTVNQVSGYLGFSYLF
jgi:outer membrane beta-barrel protein